MHHDYDVLNRCKRCGAHKARFAEDEEPCESEADRLAAEVKRLSAALEASDRRVEVRDAEIKRLNEGMVAASREALQQALVDAQVQNAAHVTDMQNATRALQSIQTDNETVLAVNAQLRARIENLEQAMRGDEAGLINEIRELRAAVRRSEEAVRVVADAIEARFPSDASSDGAHLRAWLRRNHVRIVRGDPRPAPIQTTCPECRTVGGHKFDCNRGRTPEARAKCDACGVVGGHKWRCPVFGGLKYRENANKTVGEALADGDTVALANRLIASWEREAQVTQQSLDEATDLLARWEAWAYGPPGEPPGDMLPATQLFIGPQRCSACKAPNFTCAVHAEPKDESNG